MWTSNENLPNTKVVDLEKLHKFGIQHFFIWARKIKIILVYKMVPKILRNHKPVPTSISLSVSPLPARTPPVDLVHGASADNWTQESTPGTPRRPLGLSSCTHVSLDTWALATPPTLRRAASYVRHLTVERLWPGSTYPRSSLASPRSPLAYK